MSDDVIPDRLTIWITGPPASGKTTLAKALGVLAPRPSCVVDGEALRATVSRTLGFSRADRALNCARAADEALRLASVPAWALVALVSPYTADRGEARRRHDECGVPFVEVHLDTPLDVRRARDRKGLYERAARGQLTGLTGFDAPYEAPEDPELRLRPAEPALQAATVLETIAAFMPSWQAAERGRS